MYTNETIERAQKELDYIKSVNPTSPGSNFDNDRTFFAEYCNMQANHFEHGFPLIAEEMRQCRDIAKPNFRATARKNGRIVAGTKVLSGSL